jgi:transcriptional regulator with XRE-family HTH domain
VGWKRLKEGLARDPEVREAYAVEYPYANVAGAVAETRARFGLTQAQLAERIGTTQSVIARLEGGRHAVSTSLLRRIAAALDVDWAPIFRERNEQPMEESVVETWRVISQPVYVHYDVGRWFPPMRAEFVVESAEEFDRSREYVSLRQASRSGRPEMTIFANRTDSFRTVRC